MKIGSLDKNTAPAPVSGERAAPASGKDLRAGETEASAKVELSHTAALLAGGDDSFDAEKVKRIADAIRDGKYQVNAEAIADKLIANAQELLGKNPH